MRKGLSLLIISFIICAFSYNVYSQEYMYASQSPTIMREKSTNEATIVSEIPKGEKLVVVGKEDRWIKVMYNDKIGYVDLAHVSSSSQAEEAKMIDFLDLRTQYKQNKEAMTKIKFETWWKETRGAIEGSRIISKGYVDAAKETWTGKLIIRLDVDAPSDTGSSYDIELRMNPEKDKEIAAQLDNDEVVTFTGKVALFDFVLGSLLVNVEDVIILSHEKAQ